MSEKNKTKLFLSYGRRDAAELATRLRNDLEKLGYEVWQDMCKIRAGKEWEEQIVDGLRSTQVVIALLSPHAVRRSTDPNNPDNVDSVCLDELTFARFATPPTPIVPVMAIPCEPPFPVFRLDYVSMTQWMHSDDEYRLGFERLVAGIEAAASGKPLPARRWHHCLPVLDFAVQLHEKRRDFVGRQWLFDEIDAWRTSSSTERALLIVGDPGIGKSAFLAEMIHRNSGGQVLAYHLCQADDPETLRPSTFVMSLAGMIAGRIPIFANLLESPRFQALFDPKTVSSRPAHVFDQGLLAALHQFPAPPDGIRYLLIDALDEALTFSEGQLNIVSLLSTRLNRFPAWLRIVATTRREADVLVKLSSLRATSLDAHRQDNLDDIEGFIEARLRTPNLAERLAASRVPRTAVQHKLREKADGNFLYVSQALQDIERDNYSFSCLDELPQGLNQWYEDWFARKFPNPKFDFVDARKVLEVILAAKEPLTLHLLNEITGLDPSYGLPETLSGLSTIIREINGRFSMFHKSVADWLKSSAVAYKIALIPGHDRISSRFIEAVAHIDSRMNTDHDYWFKYGLSHLAAAGVLLLNDTNPFVFTDRSESELPPQSPTAASVKAATFASLILANASRNRNSPSTIRMVPDFMADYLEWLLKSRHCHGIAHLAEACRSAATTRFVSGGCLTEVRNTATGELNYSIRERVAFNADLWTAYSLCAWTGSILFRLIEVDSERRWSTQLQSHLSRQLGFLRYLVSCFGISDWSTSGNWEHQGGTLFLELCDITNRR